MKWVIAIALVSLSSCSFLREANEFKGRGTIDLLFPFDLIPGLDSVLPHVVLDISGGFEWHNDEVKHNHEMEKLRLKSELIAEGKHEKSIEQIFLDTLRDELGSITVELRGDNKVGS